ALPGGQAPAGRPHHPAVLDRRGERGVPGPRRRRARARPDRVLSAPMPHATPRPTHQPTPLTVYLPFNRDCLRGEFTPAKTGAVPPAPWGHWLLVQDQALMVVQNGDRFHLPRGERPTGIDGAVGD